MKDDMPKYYAPAIKGGKTILVPVLGFLDICEVARSQGTMRELVTGEGVGRGGDDDWDVQYRVAFYNEEGELNALVIEETEQGLQLCGVLNQPEKGFGFRMLEVGGRYYQPKWEQFKHGRQVFPGARLA